MENKVEYAGFWIRTAACIIDYLILLIPLWIINLIISLIFYLPILSSNGPTGLGENIGLLISLVLQLTMVVADLILGTLYYAFMESSSGQASLGKMICRLKVMDDSGNKLTFRKALTRSLIKGLSWILLGLPFILIAFMEKKQGVHDLVAKTYVVKKV